LCQNYIWNFGHWCTNTNLDVSSAAFLEQWHSPS